MKRTYETVLLDHAKGIATVTLNRPEKRNALSPQMIQDVLDALDHVEHCSCGVLVITGAAEAFCAGLDLDHLKALVDRTQAEHREDSQRIAWLMRRVYDFPKPTIAAVNGPAIAGGTGIVSVCDFAYAVPTAKFGYTEARIGFVPAIVSTFLVEQVGARVARDLMLTARIFEAEEARTIGLINGVVEAADLLAAVHKTAQTLLANSPASLDATKKLLSAYAAERLDFELEHGIAQNAFMRTQPDFLEGVSSFLEKRKPDWPSRTPTSKTVPC
jgi:methylglutaconyl-CoA hydratase